MNPGPRPRTVLLSILALQLISSALLVAEEVPASDGWSTRAPREEIRPLFKYDARGGPDASGALITQTDAEPGQAGWWEKAVPIEVESGIDFPRCASRPTWNPRAGRLSRGGSLAG